ncbi:MULTISPECIES: sodium:solute symporter family protein [Rheinheimera]|uniref:Sodium:solute symporter n=1 Tax=Rheinheimera marina TaxID=1774958 RepID=A0ABV9JQ66_9GAMM
MNPLYFLVGFGCYLLLMIGLSFWVSRGQRNQDDFLLAGRKVSGGLTFGTTIATMIGTGTSMGAVGYAYGHGWTGMMYGVGGAVGILLLASCFASVRELKFSTMSEELSYYTGANRWVKQGSALLIFLASLGWLGAHIIGGALYLSWMTGLDMLSAKLLITLAFTIYVAIGGYKAVVWTDSLMAIILFSGFLLMGFSAVQAVGGWQPLTQFWQQASAQQLFHPLNTLPAISLAVAVAVGVLATPSFRQRIYSGRSVSSVRRSFLFAGGLYLCFAFIPALIGVSARFLLPELANPQFAFTSLAVLVLPTLAAMLVLLAGLSATLSSASSDSIAAVTVVMHDLQQGLGRPPLTGRRAVWASRLAVLLVSLSAFTLSLLSNNLVGYITSMIATLMSGLCVVGLLGRFWLRLTWQGGVAALVVAVSSSLSILSHADWLAFWGNPVLPALALASTASVLVSLWTKPGLNRQQALLKLHQQSPVCSNHTNSDDVLPGSSDPKLS